MRKTAYTLCLLLTAVTTVSAYGPAGHEIVGAIADELLAKRPTGAKVTALLDGMTLERASTIPDEIKGWDKKGPDDPKAYPHYPDHPAIDAQLREFWRANQPTHDASSASPSHHWFHYTDVPVLRGAKYGEGKQGRNQWDVVHMIPFCVGVLRGDIPENNPRKITKPVAVILLCHYVGDIHQPLHVGANYFDEGGQPIDPDGGKSGLGDEGGNTVTLQLRDDPPRGRGIHKKKLHGFWDLDAVNTLLPPVEPTASKEEKQEQMIAGVKKVSHELASSEPAGWRVPAKNDPKDYAQAWADEILPIAREAHERLNFTNMHALPQEDRVVATGDAEEKTMPDGKLYREWASKIVREELHKAGWRLADLLEKSVTSSTTIGASLAPAIAASPTAPASAPAAPAKAEPSAPVKVETPAPPAVAAPASASAYGPYPSNYKEIVTAWLKTNSFNGATIDWQGDPKPADLPSAQGAHTSGYLVIFNSPGENGGIARTRSVLIRDGKVVKFTGFDR